MYRRKDFPKPDDLVIGKVIEISPISVKVELEEYENAYGIIPIDELSTRRIKNIKEIVDIGKKIVCVVLDSDPNNRLATVSLKRVSEGMKKMKLYQYKREQSAYKLLEILSKKLNIPMQEIEKEIIDNIIYNGKKLYEVWEEAYIYGKDVLRRYIPEKYIDTLYEIIKKYFNVPKYKREGVIEMYTLEPNGIEILKDILSKISEKGVNVVYSGAPVYKFRIESYNPKELEKKIKDIRDILEEYSKKYEIFYEIREE